MWSISLAYSLYNFHICDQFPWLILYVISIFVSWLNKFPIYLKLNPPTFCTGNNRMVLFFKIYWTINLFINNSSIQFCMVFKSKSLKNDFLGKSYVVIKFTRYTTYNRSLYPGIINICFNICQFICHLIFTWGRQICLGLAVVKNVGSWWFFIIKKRVLIH